METYNIPTANKFENLTKQDEPTNENQQIKTNKDQTANDEPTSGIQQSSKDQDNRKDSETATASTSNIQNTNATLSTESHQKTDRTQAKQPQPNGIRNNTSNDADTIILCDSNGRHSLADLKCFADEILNLKGKWSSPGGEAKLFCATKPDLVIKWFGWRSQKLVIQVDSAENFLTQKFESLVNKSKGNKTIIVMVR